MKLLRSIICLMLCVLLCAGCAAPKGEVMETNLLQYAVERAEYPSYPKFVNAEDYYRKDGSWDHEAYERANEAAQQALQCLGKTDEVDCTALLQFADRTVGRVLLSCGMENGVYSPVSLYTAMALLAEICGGESRAQVLAAMGAAELEVMRTAVHRLWINSYCDSGVATSRMASSLWLNERVDYRADTLRTLAENYFASAYRVTMGTDEAGNAIGQWINEQTEGLLREETRDIQTEASTLLQMYTTLYFKARWMDTFQPDATEKDAFYPAEGEEITCDFMHARRTGGYRVGEGYTAASLPFAAGGGYMTFCLPDENVTLAELLSRDELVSQLREMTHYGSIVHWTLPRFDVKADMPLNDLMKELGVTAAFDRQSADFSPLTGTPAYLSSVRQAARVKIDEEGVEAAAFTEMAVCTSAMPMGEVEMTLNRPFLFVIYDANGLPLFAGTVQKPQ